MKGRELAKEILERPDADIVVSVDVSTCDDDAGRRIFCSDIFEVQDDSNIGQITLLVGETSRNWKE